MPHFSRFDARFPSVGFVTWDEASLLYNYGLALKGRRMVEVGCWVGWSTVFLGLSGVELTVVDPLLEGAPQGDACRDSLARAGLSTRVQLVPGYSPKALIDLAAQGNRWDAFFIDGNHEDDAPLMDAKACTELAASDAIVLFHDLVQPNIAGALRWLLHHGWNCGIHRTALFMGVAWRGQLRRITVLDGR